MKAERSPAHRAEHETISWTKFMDELPTHTETDSVAEGAAWCSVGRASCRVTELQTSRRASAVTLNPLERARQIVEPTPSSLIVNLRELAERPLDD